jgi:hypothetical protein
MHHIIRAAVRRLHRRTATTPAATPPPTPSCDLVHVPDPEGHGEIIALHGLVDATGIERLLTGTGHLAVGSRLYLDLTDAIIRTGPWMRMLESVADSLELRGVEVRITGVSPSHPDLGPRPGDVDRTL